MKCPFKEEIVSSANGIRMIPKEADGIERNWLLSRVSSDAYLPSAKETMRSEGEQIRLDWSEKEWAAFSRRFHGMVTRICLGAWPHVDNEFHRDCQQEADLLLWQLRHKLSALSEGSREAYASLCVRRRALRSLSAEAQRRRRTLSMTSTHGGEYVPENIPGFNPGAGTRAIVATEPTLSDADLDLLKQIGDGNLSAALQRLAPRDYDILNLFFAWGMTDPEIAGYLGKTTVMVKARRNRAIGRLRRAFAYA